jgi:hypothetical protein
MLGRVVVALTVAVVETMDGSVDTITLLRAAHPAAKNVANAQPVTISTKNLLFMSLSSFRLITVLPDGQI